MDTVKCIFAMVLRSQCSENVKEYSGIYLYVHQTTYSKRSQTIQHDRVVEGVYTIIYSIGFISVKLPWKWLFSLKFNLF